MQTVHKFSEIPDVINFFSLSSKSSREIVEKFVTPAIRISTTFHDLGLIPELPRPGTWDLNSRICMNPVLYFFTFWGNISQILWPHCIELSRGSHQGRRLKAPSAVFWGWEAKFEVLAPVRHRANTIILSLNFNGHFST